MGFLFALLAFFCGLALAIDLDTGSLNDKVVTGIMGMLLAAAIMAGVAVPSWPWHRNP